MYFYKLIYINRDDHKQGQTEVCEYMHSLSACNAFFHPQSKPHSPHSTETVNQEFNPKLFTIMSF